MQGRRYGANPSTIISRGEKVQDKKYFEVTYYTAGYESTQKKKGDPAYGITASGTYVKEGRTAACPKPMKFGTKLYVEGLGYRICEDRGGAIKTGKLDIYVDDLNKARELGRQRLLVTILSEGE